MLRNSTRRWLAGLGVAGALVAASATPAFAEEAIELGVYVNDTTIAAGSDGKVESPILFSSEPVTVFGLTARFDYRDLGGKVKLTSEGGFDDCTAPEEGVLVCTDPFEHDLYDWGSGYFRVVIAPTAEAKDGDVGNLKVTISADGLASTSATGQIRVGEGVDLAGGDEVKVSAAPGSRFTAPIKLGNAGQTTAKGAVAVFDNDYAIRADKRHSNCTYEDGQLRTCRFSEEVAPGQSLSGTLAYRLGEDTYAPGRDYGYYNWMTVAEFEDFTKYLTDNGYSVGEPGDGEPLTLSSPSARSFQADIDPENNWSSLEVTATGTNGTDLAAIGDKVKGKAGDKVIATVGFHNNGPATLDYSRGFSSVTYMAVAVPEGTTVVDAPDNCLPTKGEEQGEPGEPGARNYFCYAPPFLKAGDEETFEFALRIDKVIANATGTVKINIPCQCDGGFYADLKPANDTAKILVNASGGEGGGDGGTLPITGASTGLIASLGALLLAAGVGGYLVAKRRRTRFVA
ncbi:LPXTG-motif cell wall anchor domain-containing protein [Micromonospora echinaurantiaca]|uniref:LPXTG-motif cell wall anchor domain-containing protein n=1 Tax=Micromonospora echinaurantiaca TaxID=47857 RepID=A0A1C5KBI9_9ACTN|nr:LPXTG cell wall anchor domain-containing protein [Micromonospora echinaurantiaca]SCG79736.1 LPXTG-motif cell wall anchor domain-containing protein [Micromonospora echinaurantiaca]